MRSEDTAKEGDDREAEEMKDKLRVWIDKKQQIGPHRKGLVDIYFAEYLSKERSHTQAFAKTKFMLKQIGFDDIMCEWNKWLTKDQGKEDKEALASLWETDVKAALIEKKWDSNEACRWALAKYKEELEQKKLQKERRTRAQNKELGALEQQETGKRKRKDAAAETHAAAVESEGQSSEAAVRPSRGSLDKEASDEEEDAGEDDMWMSEYLDALPRDKGEEEDGRKVVEAALKQVQKAKLEMRGDESGRRWGHLYLRLLSAAIMASHNVDFCPESNSEQPECQKTCRFCGTWRKLDAIKKESSAFFPRSLR